MVAGFRFIGLTGGIGSGKSSVARVLSDLGLGVISADGVVHDLLAHNTEVRDAVRSRFGEAVFSSDGQIVRKKLGEKVFTSLSDREWLENLLHPRVRQVVEATKLQFQSEGKKVMFYEVPLLFEKGLQSQFDEIWLVTAPEELRIKRVQARDGLGIDEIKNRIRAQVPEPVKEKGATAIFRNVATAQELADQVTQLCKDRGLL